MISESELNQLAHLNPALALVVAGVLATLKRAVDREINRVRAEGIPE